VGRPLLARRRRVVGGGEGHLHLRRGWPVTVVLDGRPLAPTAGPTGVGVALAVSFRYARGLTVVSWPIPRADWSRLTAWLRGCTAETVVVSWKVLDGIVGGMPASAIRHYPQWWHGNRSHARAWWAAGFEPIRIRPGEDVTFLRTNVPATPAITPTSELLAARALLAGSIGVDERRLMPAWRRYTGGFDTAPWSPSRAPWVRHFGLSGTAHRPARQRQLGARRSNSLGRPPRRRRDP
jgi:hypothetical protein